MKKLIAAAFIALALVVGVGSSVQAAANPPHHKQITKSHQNCTAYFIHGNAYGGGYAKFREGAGLCKNNSYVQVTVAKGGKLVNGPKCYLTSTNGCAGISWAQSFVPSSNIFASKLVLCSSTCKTFTFSGF